MTSKSSHSRLFIFSFLSCTRLTLCDVPREKSAAKVERESARVKNCNHFVHLIRLVGHDDIVVSTKAKWKDEKKKCNWFILFSRRQNVPFWSLITQLWLSRRQIQWNLFVSWQIFKVEHSDIIFSWMRIDFILRIVVSLLKSLVSMEKQRACSVFIFL